MAGKHQTQQQRLDVVLKLVTKDDWEIIVCKAVEQAKAGNSAARQWLSDYVAPMAIEGTLLRGTLPQGSVISSLVDLFPGLAEHFADQAANEG